MSAPALLLIDFQKAIDDPYWGRRGQPHAEDNAQRLLSHWRNAERPIFHVKHNSINADSPYRPGAEGNVFKPALAPEGDEVVIAKTANSAFIDTPLQMLLTNGGIDAIVVAGVLLENSVDASVRMASNLGFAVTIAEDAVASTERVDHTGRNWPAEDVWALSLGILKGEYAAISTTADLTQDLEATT
ncbi:MAG: cysteine hydrolase family protein [Pseudomonadota bacterium]